MKGLRFLRVIVCIVVVLAVYMIGGCSVFADFYKFYERYSSQDGVIFKSPDLNNWQMITIDGKGQVKDLVKWKGYYYILHDSYELTRTRDFITYEKVLTASSTTENIVKFEDKLLVTCVSNKVYFSYNGEDWGMVTVAGIGSEIYAQGITIGDKFYYVNDSIAATDNLIQWEVLVSNGDMRSDINCIEVFNDYLVLKPKGKMCGIYISEIDDLENWEYVSITEYSNSVDMIKEAGGRLYIAEWSQDILWYTENLEDFYVCDVDEHSNISDIAYNDGKWIIVDNNYYGDYELHSDDGEVFYQVESTSGRCTEVVYIEEAYGITLVSPVDGEIYINDEGLPDIILRNDYEEEKDITVDIWRYTGPEQIEILDSKDFRLNIGLNNIGAGNFNWYTADDVWQFIDIYLEGELIKRVSVKLVPWVMVSWGSPTEFLYENSVPIIDVAVWNLVGDKVIIRLSKAIDTYGGKEVIREWEIEGAGFFFADSCELPVEVGSDYENLETYYVDIISQQGQEYGIVSTRDFRIMFDEPYIGTNYYTYTKKEKDLIIQKYVYGDLYLYVNGEEKQEIEEQITVIQAGEIGLEKGDNTIQIKDANMSVLYEVNFKLETMEGEQEPSGPSEEGEIDILGPAGVRGEIVDKLNVSQFQTLISKVQMLRGKNYNELIPYLRINLRELAGAGIEHISPGIDVSEFENKNVPWLDFSLLQEVEFMGVTVLEWFRGLISAGMIYFTIMYFYKKIVPDKVIE